MTDGIDSKPIHYVLATSRPWHEDMIERLGTIKNVRFHLITAKSDLSKDNLDRLNPRAIFFPHWSFIIPSEVYQNFECVIFHMTDVPFGRGGSPLQNLISRGINETKLTALRCTEEVDAGPVYLKEPLSLRGSAEEIYLRAGKITESMIKTIIATNPIPKSQEGEVVFFSRRKPEQSSIDSILGLPRLHDHIRMLDAEGYPKAFLDTGEFHIEFGRASLKHGKLVADVTITEKLNE